MILRRKLQLVADIRTLNFRGRRPSVEVSSDKEKIPLEALTRFETKALRREVGDLAYGSMDALIKDLHRTRHARRL